MNVATLIPVHGLTGFLGSGKTTLLNGALQEGFGPETAVIVNEFGDVGLDQHFLAASSEEVMVLKSGCLCCTIRTDLVSTLLQLISSQGARSQALRRIVIETSGISDPLPILQTLRSDFNLLTRFRVGAVVCTVDACALATLHSRSESLAQITAADALAITKRDLVDADAARRIEDEVATLNPLAEILPGNGLAFVRWLEHAEVRGNDAGQALETERLPQAVVASAHSVRSIIIRGAAPSWPHFAVWLTRLIFLHGDRVLRTKGLVFDAERGVWIGVHGVRHFFHPPVHLTLASPPSYGMCLIFITERLDPARIDTSYRRMLKERDASRGAFAPAM